MVDFCGRLAKFAKFIDVDVANDHYAVATSFASNKLLKKYIRCSQRSFLSNERSRIQTPILNEQVSGNPFEVNITANGSTCPRCIERSGRDYPSFSGLVKP